MYTRIVDLINKYTENSNSKQTLNELDKEIQQNPGEFFYNAIFFFANKKENLLGDAKGFVTKFVSHDANRRKRDSIQILKKAKESLELLLKYENENENFDGFWLNLSHNDKQKIRNIIQSSTVYHPTSSIGPELLVLLNKYQMRLKSITHGEYLSDRGELPFLTHETLNDVTQLGQLMRDEEKYSDTDFAGAFRYLNGCFREKMITPQDSDFHPIMEELFRVILLPYFKQDFTQFPNITINVKIEQLQLFVDHFELFNIFISKSDDITQKGASDDITKKGASEIEKNITRIIESLKKFLYESEYEDGNLIPLIFQILCNIINYYYKYSFCCNNHGVYETLIKIIQFINEDKSIKQKITVKKYGIMKDSVIRFWKELANTEKNFIYEFQEKRHNTPLYSQRQKDKETNTKVEPFRFINKYYRELFEILADHYLQTFYIAKKEKIKELRKAESEKNKEEETRIIEMIEMLYRDEPEGIFNLIADRFKYRTRSNSYARYCTLVLYQILINEESKQMPRIYKFLTEDSFLSLESECNAKNYQIRYQAIRCLARIVAFFPEILEKQNNVNFILGILFDNNNLILINEDTIKPKKKIRFISLYLLSLMLSYSSKLFLDTYKESFIDRLKDFLIHSNNYDFAEVSHNPDINESLFDCIGALSNLIDIPDVLSLWVELLDIYNSFIKEKKDFILRPEHFQVFIVFIDRLLDTQNDSSLTPQELAQLLNRGGNDSINEHTLNFIFDATFVFKKTLDASYLLLSILQPYFDKDIITRNSDRIVQFLTTPDSIIGNSDVPIRTLNLFSANYPELFKEYSEYILNSLIQEIQKDESKSCELYIQYKDFLFNVFNNVLDNINIEIINEILVFILGITEKDSKYQTEEIYLSIFKLIQAILEKQEDYTINKTIVTRIFKLVHQIYIKKMYSDDIALAILTIISLIYRKAPRLIGYHIVHQSVCDIATKAYQSKNTSLAKLAHETLYSDSIQ